MTEFKYYTRKKSSPQGKARIYFTAHPHDYRKYFDEIRDEILKRQNCVIFYLEPTSEIDDKKNYEFDLKQMKLLVVPVTAKLLTTPNRTIDFDVPFALKNHIPVLPIMQEQGLGKLFIEKFGDLQYLERNNSDSMALSFDEKLTKYLNSVITGDELLEKVRAAFDAYVFLSYRKKDRRYAQQLMELIHRNPICRDIAIWYDEFLTPGEDFNEAIKEALEKCQIFALTVTPNLINEINYVMNTEYPMAKKMGKSMLPAEMLPTDRKKLNELYDGIPEIVETENSEKLTERLISLLTNFVIKENDNDPQHNFFIGLAYLSGIDVEVNHERAFKLISSSAEAGCEEAIEKLVEMYNHGDSVKRDGQKAIEWQKRLIAFRKKLNEEEPNEQNAVKYVQACMDLHHSYYELSERHFAENGMMLFDIIDECRKFKEIYENHIFYEAMCECYVYLGIIQQNGENYKEAEEYFERAFGMYLAAFSMGLSVSIEKASTKAENTSEETVNDSFRSDWESKQVELDRRLLFIKLNLIKLKRYRRDYENASKYGKEAIEIAEKLVNNPGTYQDMHNLSLSYARYGYIFLDLKDLEKAEEFFLLALEIDKKLVEEFQCLSYTTDLIFDYVDLAAVSKLRNDYVSAERYYLRAYEMSSALVEQTDNPKEKRQFARICYELGEMYHAKNDLSKEEKYYTKSLDMQKQIAGKFNLGYMIVKTLVALGDIELSKGNIDIFENYYFYACKFLKADIDAKDRTEDKNLLVYCYLRLGEVLKNKKIYVKARIYFLEATHISWYLVHDKEELSDLQDLYVGYKGMGECCLAEDDVKGAEESYMKALKYKQRIVEVSDHPQDKRELANCYRFLGVMYYQGCEKEKARESFAKAVEILETLHSMFKDDMLIYGELGHVYFDFGSAELNKSHMERALEIAEEISDRYPEVPLFRDDVNFTAAKIKEIFGEEEVEPEPTEIALEKEEPKNKKSFWRWFKKK